MWIRRATVADAPAICALIRGVADLVLADPTQVGAQRFLSSIDPDALAVALCDPDFSYWVAHDHKHVLGTLAIRGRTHVHHLFVARSRHRTGIASQLWSAAQIARDQVSDCTVNSSVNAVPFYATLGFVVVGPQVNADGLSSVPMILSAALQPKKTTNRL